MKTCIRTGPEAIAGGVLSKRIEIWQNSQENNCATVTFLIKRDSGTEVFLFCETLKNTFFYRTPPGDCFCWS